MWVDSFGESDNVVFYVFCAVAAIILVVAIGVIALSCIVKITSPGASIDFYIAFGALAIVVTVLLRGVNPEWSNSLGIEIACQFYVSLLVFGLLWFIGGIMIRCCAIYDYYKTKDHTLLSRTEWRPNLWMFLLMIIDGVLVLVWVIQFKLETVAHPITPNVYECVADHKAKWEITLSVIHAVYIVLACLIVGLAIHVSRKIDATNAIVLAVIAYNLLFVAIAATLIYLLYEPSEANIVMTSKYAIVGGLELYVVLFTLILLLFAKIVAARRASRGEYKHSSSSAIYEEANHTPRNSIEFGNSSIGGHSNPAKDSGVPKRGTGGSASRNSYRSSSGSLSRSGYSTPGSVNRNRRGSGSLNRNTRSSANQFSY